MFEHAVEYNHQFAHGRDQRHLFRLASSQQPLVEVPDSRVVAAGYQRSHVEDGQPSPVLNTWGFAVCASLMMPNPSS